MKREIYKEIKIPDGVEAEIFDGTKMKVKGPEGENEKRLNIGKLDFEINDKKIRVGSKKATKKEKKQINTIASVSKNMIKGVQNKFEYKLKVCFSHFPITVEIKGKDAIIKNFLGEKTPRKAKIPEGVEAEVNKDIIKVRSVDKESAGQAAANFETATKVKKRDRRIFQDGIFITNKAGREL